jgi:5-formyltetrahydrofolate cyclo-ligase
MIMLYAEMGAEVITRPFIREMLRAGKRIVLPYVIEGGIDMGFAEIHDADADIIIGKKGVPEPRPELRTNYFRSDLEAVVCPGVAFDRQGGRLGRGLGCYDAFLRELRGKVLIIGIAFDCQIMPDKVPFDYHDIPMDMVITESGIVVGAPVAVAASPAG